MKNEYESLKLYVLRVRRHELKRSIKRKRLRLLRREISRRNKLSSHFVKRPKNVKHDEHSAPSDFSFIDCPSEVINFFDSVKKSLRWGVPVALKLKDVEKMGPDTLILLCAFINDKKSTFGTAIMGDTPAKQDLRRMFIDSKFYCNVESPLSEINAKRDVTDGLIHRITRRKVESELAGQLTANAMLYTYGTVDLRKQKYYPILIECMSNTWNHASLDKDHQTFDWWLLAYNEPNSKITKFCFLDLGVGMFQSLEYKRNKHLVEEMLKFFDPESNVNTLKNIFRGRGKTSTNMDERGKGLQKIYDIVKNEETISRFTIVSNDVFARIGYNMDDDIKKLKENFNGTLYYWELKPTYVKK